MEGILLPTRAWPSFELLGVLDFSTLAYYNLADLWYIYWYITVQYIYGIWNILSVLPTFAPIY